MCVSWWVGVDSAPWWHDLGPWEAVSTRAGIPAGLACMHWCMQLGSLQARPVWNRWDTRSAHIRLHLWPVCSDCSPSQIDAGGHPGGHGNIHGNATSWCIYHLYNINSAGTNKRCFIYSEKVNCNWTFQLTVISTLSLTVSHSGPTHPPLCGYSWCVEITETPPSSHPINPFQVASWAWLFRV